MVYSRINFRASASVLTISASLPACFPPATQKVVTESIERVVDTVNSVIGEARSYSSTLESRLTEVVITQYIIQICTIFLHMNKAYIPGQRNTLEGQMLP